jgi:hypothetical protein
MSVKAKDFKFWLRVTVFAVATLGFAYLVVDSALAKDVSWWSRLILAAFGFTLLIILWAVNRDLHGLLAGKVKLRDRKTSEISFNLILTLLGAMASVVGMISPKTAVESAAKAIENTVKAIAKTLDRVDSNTKQTRGDVRKILDAQGIDVAHPLLPKLAPHIWGERGEFGDPDCLVTYKFETKGNALIVNSVKNPPGEEQGLHWNGTITKETLTVLETRTDSSGADYGNAVTFDLESNGLSDRLTWNRYKSPPLPLLRCDTKR